jgi:hypothetical protein
MNRSGAALFVALIVVLLGGMVTVLATMVAMSEVRSGAGWRDRTAAVTLASSSVARSRERAEAELDSMTAGESVALDDALSLLRLGDSIALLTAATALGGGVASSSRLLRASLDTLGTWRLTAYGSRGRYHPIP